MYSDSPKNSETSFAARIKSSCGIFKFGFNSNNREHVKKQIFLRLDSLISDFFNRHSRPSGVLSKYSFKSCSKILSENICFLFKEIKLEEHSSAIGNDTVFFNTFDTFFKEADLHVFIKREFKTISYESYYTIASVDFLGTTVYIISENL